MTFPPRAINRPNRRASERLELSAPARLTDGAAEFQGQIENVGAAGAAFITREMEPELPVGARVTLVAPGAGDAGADLAFSGHVVRTDVLCDGGGDSRAYAVEFDERADA